MKSNKLAILAFLGASLLVDARADITTGLVGYWTLDEGTGSLAADTSGSGNNGTLTQFADAGFASMWTADSWFNNAILLNQNGETTNYISVPSSASLNMTATNKQWTLAAWIKPSASLPNDTGIICKGLYDKEAFVMSLNSMKVRAKLRNQAGTGGFNITGTTVLKPGTWYHVVAACMVPKGTNNSGLMVYVNGVRETGSDGNTYTTLYTSTQPVTIGTRANSSGTLLGFQGVMDDVRVYTRLLSPDDIWQLYTNNAPGSAHVAQITKQPRDVVCYSNDSPSFSVGTSSTNSYVPLTYQWQLNGVDIPGATKNPQTISNVTGGGTYSVVVSNFAGTVTSAGAVLTVLPLPAPDTTSALVGWWKMDDASGSATAVDASGNGNTGTLAGFTDLPSVWDDGLSGGALDFNGDFTGANVVAVPGVGMSSPAGLDFNASPVFTLAAWVKASLTQSNQAGLIAKGTGAGGEQFCLDINGANYRFFVRDTNGVTTSIPTTGPFDGYWQHLAAVVNATNGIMNFYLNGILTGSAPAPFSLLATNHEVSIGNRQAGTAEYNYPFTGAMDDVRIYSRDLTAADVYALYAANAYPMIVAQIPANGDHPFVLFAGSSPTFKVSVNGAAPLVYQWYTNGVADAAGTSASYQITNVREGFNTYCIVTNSLGSATSYVWTATVAGAPTAPYPQVVLQDKPIGYWRLNEAPVDNASGNNGVVANDYLNGHFGLYANTVLGLDSYSRALSNQFGYYPATEPDLTAAQFGYFGGPSNYVAAIQGIDLSKPANQTGRFSIEAWVKGEAGQSFNAGIVAKGAWGAEQFTLDTGGTSYSYRFTMRDAGKTLRTTSSNTNFPDGNWHHLVGVLDEANSNLCLYVDGVRVSSTACPSASGVLSTTVPMTIGCRLGSGSVGYNQQFFGTINDVAIYGEALTSSQVMNHYLAGGIPPVITQNPVSYTNVNEGTTLVVAAQGSGGTAPVNTQWYDLGTGNIQPGVPLTGQTNNTLVISNVTAALNGHSLALSLSNAYGHPYSSSVYVTINSGVPVVTVAPASVTVYVNMPVVFTATAIGSEPFTYQWSKNGTAVGGATTSAYTAIAELGNSTIACTVTGPGGNGSNSGTLTGRALPSDSYGQLIMQDQPMAYWRLDESSGASVAIDYAGGHNANYYNAVNGLSGFSPADAAAGFGMNGFTSGSMALEQANSGVQLIDLSSMGPNGSFSVEAWVKAPTGQANGGIVTKGWGHAEQFVLDAYGNAFRFYGRDPSNNTHGPTSTVHPDGLWHHLVGVYDGTNGLINLFVDGTVQGSATMTPGLGILPTTVPTSIGARTSSSTDSAYSLQLSNAVVDEVAIYPYALSTNQVAQHYATAAIPPQFVQDLPAQVYAYVGFPLSLSVLASSTTPMTYQWQRNGLNLTDGGGISGANSNTLTLSLGEFAAGNTFQVFVTNQATPVAAVSTRGTLAILPHLGFNGFGTQWSSQGNTAGLPFFVSANALELTDGAANRVSSSYFGYPVYIGGFLASFTYQAGGNKAADGVCFVVQNDARGAAALGVGGGGKGYNGITNSVALEMNIYTSGTRIAGCTITTNGVTGGTMTSTAPVDLKSGDPIDITVLYANGNWSLTFTDAVAMTSFTTNVSGIDVPSLVGAQTAYVGFSGASGSATAVQTISNFSFVSLPVLSIQATPDNHVVIAWSAATGGYVLQQSASADPASWTDVTVPAITVGGFNQVTLAVSLTGSFYRLINRP